MKWLRPCAFAGGTAFSCAFGFLGMRWRHRKDCEDRFTAVQGQRVEADFVDEEIVGSATLGNAVGFEAFATWPSWR